MTKPNLVAVATAAMPPDADERQLLLAQVARYDLPELFHNQILVATHIRPEKSKGGVYIPDKARDEDRYQSKAGLIIALGPTAGPSSGTDSWDWNGGLKLHDWVMYRSSDGWNFTLGGSGGLPCRFLLDVSIKARLTNPEQVW